MAFSGERAGCRETGKDGIAHGEKNAATIRREHIVKMMAGRAEQPESANGMSKVPLRQKLRPTHSDRKHVCSLG